MTNKQPEKYAHLGKYRMIDENWVYRVNSFLLIRANLVDAIMHPEKYFPRGTDGEEARAILGKLVSNSDMDLAALLMVADWDSGSFMGDDFDAYLENLYRPLKWVRRGRLQNLRKIAAMSSKKEMTISF